MTQDEHAKLICPLMSRPGGVDWVMCQTDRCALWRWNGDSTQPSGPVTENHEAYAEWKCVLPPTGALPGYYSREYPRGTRPGHCAMVKE